MRVLVIDDDKLVCASLKIILEAESDITVVGMGNHGKDAIELYEALHPDILLMDIRMDTLTGLQAAETILDRHSDARILFLTTFSDDEYIVRALKIGSKGYILKQRFENIVPALRAVWMGQSVFGDEIVSKLPTLLQQEKAVDFSCFGISEKEMEIIVQVSKGLSNKEIAEALYLSEGTVRNYLSTILDKLELRDRTQLAIFYYNQKEIQ